MDYRSGEEGDFLNIETFVWQAIFPAFNHPDLSEQQRAENDAIVEAAEGACLSAVALPERQVFVAYDGRQRRLAGFIILDRSSADYPEISWIIVSRKYWGSGVADGLIRKGLEWLGTNRPIKTSVHYYLERAVKFFGRYGFEDTGETEGDYLIPRLLLLREAGPLPTADSPVPEQLTIAVDPPTTEVHNPLEPDQPDLFTAPIVASEDPGAPDPPGNKHRDIEFEIDYGEQREEAADQQPEKAAPVGLDFEFAFDAEPEPTEEEEEEDALDLVDIKTLDPALAEVAGEQITAAETPDTKTEADPEVTETVEETTTDSDQEGRRPNTGDQLNELRRNFQDYFMEMVTDLFGNHAAVDYWQMYQVSDFRQLVDNSLRQYRAGGGTTFNQLAGDLVEYFVVETAAELHNQVFPQRLLRHQTKSVEDTELFTLITDYLDLANEHERVDSDFITIAPKRLRNATKNFLLAGPGERIFFLIDQSILGNLKQGFAFTDRGFYWKAMLQPNHVIYFADSPEVRINKGAITANSHFFDTGKKSFNLKIVLLLKKLSRLFEG